MDGWDGWMDGMDGCMHAYMHELKTTYPDKLKNTNPHKLKNTYFSQTIAPSDVHYFLLKNSLSRWNFLEIFHLNEEFRPMKIAPHSLICH